MERREAVALLKELVSNNLAIPSLVALKENRRGKFELFLKCDCDLPLLRQFLAEKNLMLTEDKEKGSCVISKP